MPSSSRQLGAVGTPVRYSHKRLEVRKTGVLRSHEYVQNTHLSVKLTSSVVDGCAMIYVTAVIE